MKKFSVCSLLLAAMIGAAVTPAKTQDNMEGTVRSFIGIIGKAIVGDLDNKLKKERQPKPFQNHSSAYLETGYCQVWRADTLEVQQQCGVKKQCASNGICSFGFVWPNGGVTRLTVRGNSPLAINGQPTETVQIGSDICVTDSDPQSAFCYTKTPQSSNAVNVSRMEPRVEDIFTSEQATGEAADKRPDNELTTDDLIDGYFLLAEDDSESAEMRMKRCRLGSKLLIENRGSLTEDDSEFIRDQFFIDECFD